MVTYSDFPLSDILYYRIGPKARVVLKITSKNDLIEAVVYVQKNHISRVFPIGIGANLLMNENYFDGAILWFARVEQLDINHSSSGLVEAFASVLLDDVIQYSFSHTMVGLEWAGGLPSTVGAAIRGNVGCFGKEIKDVLQKTEVLDITDGRLVFKELGRSDLEFSYRNSAIKKNKNLLVVTGFFQLHPADENTLNKAKKMYEENIAYREKNHPLEYPNCGSVFKNIVEKQNVEKVLSIWPDARDLSENKWYGKIAMGYVIKRLGFSGFRVGGAEVSSKHCNYVINKNRARFLDVISIIDAIKKKFFETFGFYPGLEVEIVR